MCCNLVKEYYADKSQFLSELKRVLNPRFIDINIGSQTMVIHICGNVIEDDVSMLKAPINGYL